jgi:hypothetical protein
MIKKLYLLTLPFFANGAMACLSCDPSVAVMEFEPNELLFTISNYDPSGLDVEATLSIDEHGDVIDVFIDRVSRQDVPMKLLVQSIKQAKFKPALDKNCVSLASVDYVFTYSY